jgi:hypothetical protein
MRKLNIEKYIEINTLLKNVLVKYQIIFTIFFIHFHHVSDHA